MYIEDIKKTYLKQTKPSNSVIIVFIYSMSTNAQKYYRRPIIQSLSLCGNMVIQVLNNVFYHFLKNVYRCTTHSVYYQSPKLTVFWLFHFFFNVSGIT